MEVLDIAGARGPLEHIVPTVWRADAETVCILLENPKNGRWIVISLDVSDVVSSVPATHQKEAS